jgi:hypothetical protein
VKVKRANRSDEDRLHVFMVVFLACGVGCGRAESEALEFSISGASRYKLQLWRF